MEKIWIQLEGPNIAAIIQQQPPYQPIYYGNWTMMADEGIDVVIGGKRLFANFNFTADPYNPGQFKSLCNQLQTGTFHEEAPNPQQWGCFTARLLYQNKLDIGIFASKSETSQKLKSTTEQFMKSNFVAAIKAPRGYGKHRDQIRQKLSMRKFNNNPTALIQKINAANLGWTAGAAPQEWNNMSELEVLKKGGKFTPRWKIDAENRHMSFIKTFKPASNSANVKAYPDNFDWTNVGTGLNFVPPVRNQGGCGSCFAFAGTEMLGARLRITTSLKDQTILSPQHVVSCSKYTQGCSGGFGYLVGKFANDFGLLPEQCLFLSFCF